MARRLGGPQSWSGCYEEEKNLSPAGNEQKLSYITQMSDQDLSYTKI
jgi:hypothetical protein